MSRKLKIRDLTLRDGQQSLFATRLTQEQINRVLPYYKDAGFFAMEVWGGAVPKQLMSAVVSGLVAGTCFSVASRLFGRR